MRLNPNAFNRHVVKMGQQVLWRPAYACSCTNPDSGAPDPKCKLCRKHGRIWSEPLQTVVGLQKQEVKPEWENSGLWEAGDLMVTVPENSPMWNGGQFDRVTMLNAEDRFSKPLVRGRPDEDLSTLSVKRIERVFWKHPVTQALVEGGIPVVDAEGKITWGEGAPPTGMAYSITGFKYPDYFIWAELPSNRNMHSGVRLPKRVVLRRWDLISRG
ncbi:hypothetical protein FHR70_000747 [Microvirga lupini]|uniref:Uncharacterized protein n=1 Tax=Microvirga lupini TaxID=420324 RepID=A0A7W4YUS0_9HYPH|nr:hypothetical protein [Microvirga lupini]MBB3017707.1 hypothetical protein [Microvirga lupini]